MNILNIRSGDKYGRLTIIEEVNKVDRHRRFRCLCDCGGVKIVKLNILRMGGARSCGCLALESSLSNLKKALSLIDIKGVTLQNGYLAFTNGPNIRRRVHDVIVESHIGRKLKINECIHHINENRLDNRIENLQLMTKSDHMRHHMIKNQKRGVIINYGEGSCHSKLKNNDIVFIRENYTEMGKGKLALMFGVKPHTIYKVHTKLTWKHL